MRIRRFTIKNFKSIPPTGITLEFRERFCVLIGKNNAGKSNILEAIGLLFGAKNPRYLRIDPDNYHDPSHPIVIEAELQGLNWSDGKALGLSDRQCGQLMHDGKRVETSPGCVTFRLTCPPVTEESDISEEDDDGSAKQTFEVLLANRHELKRNEAFRQAVVKHLLIPPVRNHNELLSPSTWTAYGRFLRDILSDSSRSKQLAQLITDATIQLRDLLRNEAAELTRAAKVTSYVDAIDFKLTKEGNPVELLRNLTLTVTYGGRTEDISQVGTGTQSAVIIGALELCLRHRASRGIRLFCVEEPELFLHPHAQRYVADLLRKIAEEENNQVILTTHSAAILANTDILDVVRVERDENNGTQCRRVPLYYPHIEKVQRILTAETCEMLFADRVVLVEGPSESILLPGIAKVMAQTGNSREFSFDYRNISVVNVGGKDNFWPYTELLSCFGIEWRVIADRDALDGDSLQEFKSRVGISGAESVDEKIKKLLDNGVAVLHLGEIEDYYPYKALADIAGCTVEKVESEIKKHQLVWDDPSTFDLVLSMLLSYREEICRANDSRLQKVVKRTYDKTLQKMRDEGRVGTTMAKTGDALVRWLGLPKPTIALRIVQWLENHPEEVPKHLRELLEWTLQG